MNNFLRLIILLSTVVTFSVNADQFASDMENRFYVGLIGGYGSTTWSELIEVDGTVSTPVSVKEGGLVRGYDFGYQFNQFFALQFQYMFLPYAKMTLPTLIYAGYDDGGIYTIGSETQTYSIIAKLSIPIISGLPLRAYSDFGVSRVVRSDSLAWTKHITAPTFGAGLSYVVDNHWLFELGGDFSTGYGKAEVDPIYDYVPFTYAATLKVSYMF